MTTLEKELQKRGIDSVYKLNLLINKLPKNYAARTKRVLLGESSIPYQEILAICDAVSKHTGIYLDPSTITWEPVRVRLT